MYKTTIKTMIVVAAVCLAVLVLVAGPAPAGTTTGPATVKAATPADAGLKICQGPLCRLRCRTFMMNRRCRPGTLCRFKSHVICRCYYQRGTCLLRCSSRPRVSRCTRGGLCRAPIRRCQCGVPMARPGPR